MEYLVNKKLGLTAFVAIVVVALFFGLRTSVRPIFGDIDALRDQVELQAIESEELQGEILSLAEQIVLFVDDHPGSYEAHIAASKIHRYLSVYDASAIEDARFYAEAAQEIDADRPETYEELGEIELVLGNTDAASIWFAKAFGLAPETGEMRGRLSARGGVLEAEANRVERALLYFDQAGVLGYDPREDVRTAIALSEGLLGSWSALDDETFIRALTFIDFVWAANPMNSSLSDVRQDVYRIAGKERIIEMLTSTISHIASRDEAPE